jgi:hypothetical protein
MARVRRARSTVAGVMAVAAVMVFAPAAMADGPFTWSGGGNGLWSNSPNWSGTGPANDSNGAFTFPALDSSACPQSGGSPTGSCYQSDNDLTGVTATSLTIGIGGYSISGKPITLTPPAGTDGIDATLSNSSNSAQTSGNLSVPITLGSDQDWSVTRGGLTLGSISGDHSLGVSMGGGATLTLDASDTEIGAFSATGADSADHGADINGPSGVSEGAQVNGIIRLSPGSGSGTPSLNATDGNQST